MKIRLGEMSVGDILTNSFSMLLEQLPKYAVIYCIVTLPLLVLQLLVPLMVIGGTATTVSIFVALGISLLSYLILQPFGTAAVLKVVANSYLGEPITIGSAFRFALGKFWKLVGTLILAGLVIVLGFLLFVVPGIFFWIFYTLIAQVVVVENIGGGRALGRSKSLTKGHRWRILGLMILLLILGYIWSLIESLLGLALPPYSVTASLEVNYPNLVATTLIDFIVRYILLGAFGSIAMTLMYFDIRNRKEGFDIEYLSSKGGMPERGGLPTTPAESG